MTDYSLTEISEAEAARIRQQGVPDGCTIIERDEVTWFGNDYSRTASGLYVPAAYDPVDVEQYLPPKPAPPTAIDLFAGCGGFSLGLKMAGIDIRCAVEWEPIAAATYLYNLADRDTCVRFGAPSIEAKFRKHAQGWGTPTYEFNPNRPFDVGTTKGMHVGDIRQVSGAELLELGGVESVDLIVGGPPCQGMSNSNAKKCIEDPRNGLLWEYMRIVREVRPKAFLIENVPGFLRMAGGALIRAVARIANEAGYSVVANLVDAADYEVPQHRRRALVWGALGGVMNVPAVPLPKTWGLGFPLDGKSWNMLEGEDAAAEFVPEEGRWKNGVSPAAAVPEKPTAEPEAPRYRNRNVVDMIMSTKGKAS